MAPKIIDKLLGTNSPTLPPLLLDDFGVILFSLDHGKLSRCLWTQEKQADTESIRHAALITAR